MARPRHDREAERRAAGEALAAYLAARPLGTRFTPAEVAELLVAFGESVENVDEILSLRMARDGRRLGAVSPHTAASATETEKTVDTEHTTTPVSGV